MKKKKRFLTLSLAFIMFLGIKSPILNAKEIKNGNNIEFVKRNVEISKNYLKSTNHLRYTLNKSVAVSTWYALIDVHSRDYQWKNFYLKFQL